ncbi:uncharacterized protein LOC141686058 [Apium graveolens]|uniref:uncharacterized protein LOC141686058 n=1 Tax=Apium graveolens TaxID=4045 RepID=UPI003D79DA37
MLNKSPIFQMPDTQHFSDYGFQPHFDYCQAVEEARKHKRENKVGARAGRSIDGLHFKLQKPSISHELDSSKSLRRISIAPRTTSRAAPPVYITESRSGSTTPYRTAQQADTLVHVPRPMKVEMDNLPYISLRDINMDYQLQHHRISASSPMPIYLVT